MLNTFYALLGRMKYIDRWCLMRILPAGEPV